MISQFLDVLKAIGRKNRIAAIHILIVSFIIVLLELITFTLIIPVISIPLNNDFIYNNSIFIYVNKLTSFELSSFLTINNVLVLLVVVIAFKLLVLMYFQYKLKKIVWQIQVDINSSIYKYFTLSSLQEIIEAGFENVRRLINTDATQFTQGFYQYILICKHLILVIFLFLFLLQIDTKTTLLIFLLLSSFILIYNFLDRAS